MSAGATSIGGLYRAPGWWSWGESTHRNPSETPAQTAQPVESGLCVCPVGLCPSSGVHFVTQVVTREDGLFEDSDPVVVAPFNKFDGDAFNCDAVA